MNTKAVAVRDHASRRVKSFTVALVAGATALTAAFAGLAAASTHHAKRAVTPARTRAKTVTAPTPSLTPNGSTATPSTPSTPTQQSQPVQPSTQPPVAVTGGS